MSYVLPCTDGYLQQLYAAGGAVCDKAGPGLLCPVGAAGPRPQPTVQVSPSTCAHLPTVRTCTVHDTGREICGQEHFLTC